MVRLLTRASPVNLAVLSPLLLIFLFQILKSICSKTFLIICSATIPHFFSSRQRRKTRSRLNTAAIGLNFGGNQYNQKKRKRQRIIKLNATTSQAGKKSTNSPIQAHEKPQRTRFKIFLFASRILQKPRKKNLYE